MRIVIDFTAVKTQGTIVYLTGLLQTLARVDQGNEYLICLSPGLVHTIGSDLPPNFQTRQVALASHPFFRVLWGQVILPLVLRRSRAEVIYAPFDIAPLISPCPVLLAVRDPAPYSAVDYGYSLKIRTMLGIKRALVSMACRRADVVFFPSRAAAEVLGMLLGVREGRRRVVYHGVDHARWGTNLDPKTVLQKYGIDQRSFVLYVSQLYRQKRPDTLVEAFAHWIQKCGTSDHLLIFAGHASDESFYRRLRNKIRELGIADRSLFLGQVPHADLPALYNAASVFVLPSSAETFGQPYVEAMASGVPVICADTAVAREICGDAALYFPVGDSMALAQAIEIGIGDSDSLRQEMIDRGLARSKQYSWDREAQETLDLMYEIVRSHRTSEKRP